MPDSDFPFEFSSKGSKITEDNILTQSVSSDGKTVFKTNPPQPIKKYQSANKNNNNLSKDQNSNKNQQIQNDAENDVIPYPAKHSSTSYHYSTIPTMDMNSFFEHFSKYE